MKILARVIAVVIILSFIITGFVAFIDDGQDLITTEQEKQLLDY